LSLAAAARLGRLWPRDSAGVLWTCLLLLTLVLVSRPVQDPDFWWHLTTGRWIWAHGAVPHQDIYTFTVPGHIWVTHEWLTELGLAALVWLGGFTAVSLAFALATLAAWWLAARTAALWGARPYPLAAALYILGVVSGYALWGPRAQMITVLGLAFVGWALTRYRLSQGRSRALLWLPLVMVLWVNLHGGYIIAFALLAAVLVGEAWKRLAGWSPALGWQAQADLGLVTLFSLLATLLNPNGASIVAYPFQTIGSPAQMTFIAEWMSPNFHLIEMRPFELLLLAWLLGVILARRLDLSDALLGLGTLAMALQSTRSVEIFAIVGTPLAIKAWTQAWDRWRRPKPEDPTTRPTLRPLLAGAPVVLVAALVLVRSIVGVLPAAQARSQAPDYPKAAADYLAARSMEGRMFNSYGWGGYLIYRLWPQQRVFIDGSADVMGDQLIVQYITVSQLRPGWEGVLDRYRVRYVLYDSGTPLAVVLDHDPAWKAVYRDQVATLYRRVGAIP
jgi:hypothetical protein